MELLLSTATDSENNFAGDLRLVNGDFVWTEDPVLEVLQRMRSRLRFFKGEWFLDLRQGVPYFQTIMQKADDRTVLAIFSQVLRRTPGIASLETIRMVRNARERTVEISFRCRFAGGELVSSTLLVEI